MKILLAGDFNFFIYQEAFALALERLGHEVIRFEFKKYLKETFWGRIEVYFSIHGLNTYLLNEALKKVCEEYSPEIILIWRGTHIAPNTLRQIKINSPKSILVSYNNDDPFGPQYQTQGIHQKRLWVNFKNTIPFFDVNFVYREINIKEYTEAKGQNVAILRSYYIPSTKIPNTAKEYDVCFIGHYEAANMKKIRFLLENNISVKIFGTGWHNKELSELYANEIIEVRGHDYIDTISKSKIVLGFLSKLNRDTYTRRNFEIPYIGSFMLAERTEDLQGLYSEGEEADFFSNNEELLEKVIFYLKYGDKREAIASNGNKRALSSGYDIDSVAYKMLNTIKNFTEVDNKVDGDT